MYESGVESDTSPEESLPAKIKGDLEGFSRGAEVDQVEGLVASVVGPGYGSRNFGIVAWIAISRGNPAEGSLESLPDLVGGPEGRDQLFPEVKGGEGILGTINDSPVGIDDFRGREMPEFETYEEVSILFLILKSSSGWRERLRLPERIDCGIGIGL